jgi:alpha-tubulin suppressor-like RCC1 family protein
VFVCDGSRACGDGVCEATRACSFADATCGESGRRYGALAPAELANACVPATCGGAGEACCSTGEACAAGLRCEVGVCVGCVRAIGAGAAHSCAIRSDGTGACWGRGLEGQLARGIAADAAAPVAIADERGVPLDGMAAVAAGARHTCLLKFEGTVLCAGDGARGQLGRGPAVADGAVPRLVGLTGVGAIAAGDRHTCAAGFDGRVWCWGADDLGQSATGGDRDVPAAALERATTQIADAVRLAAGATHTCAIKRDGSLWCWGSHADGELGDGSIAPSSPPVQVAALGTRVRAVAAGDRFTCALDGDGAVWCWGRNDVGQSAPTAPGRVAIPTRVPLPRATAIAAGTAHACARLVGGGVRCWGEATRGRLGAGEIDGAGPSAVVEGGGDLVGAVVLAGGGAHGCAAHADGIFCWGANDASQLATMGGDRPSAARVPFTCP